MESLELAHAEKPQIEIRHATAADIATVGEVIDLARLPCARHSVFGSATRLAWTPARRLGTAKTVWVPLEIVNADACVPRPEGAGSFLHTTNGLASGNIGDEAILHGLCELVERDAIALWHFATPARQAASRIDPDSVNVDVAADIIRKLRGAEIEPIIWDVTSDVGIATIRVVLHDETSDPVTNPLPASGGAGCHPVRTIALCRALTEAAQSRLTLIAGSRDDAGRARYRETQNAAALETFRDLAHDRFCARPFASVPDAAPPSVSAALEWVISRLGRAGMSDVLVVDLSYPGMPISVVRVIVPGLEGATDSPSYCPGVRVRAQLAGNPS
jgi:ribosomal protein S12 methylthiotransferase accessory factor